MRLNVKPEQWPKDKVPLAAPSKLEDIDGRRTKTRIYAGEPILAAKIYGKGASNSAQVRKSPKEWGWWE